jgi:hypothetical protein
MKHCLDPKCKKCTVKRANQNFKHIECRYNCQAQHDKVLKNNLLTDGNKVCVCVCVFFSNLSVVHVVI